MAEPLSAAINKVLSEYPFARLKPLKGHALARYIRKELPALLESLFKPQLSGIEYLVCSSKFPGGWAYVPWVAVLDTRITRTTRKGLYVALIFAEDGQAAVLTVGQGAAFSDARLLAANREEMLAVVSAAAGFEKGPIARGSIGLSESATLYETGSVCFKTYLRDKVPSDAVILNDISQGLRVVDQLLKSPMFQTLRFARSRTRVTF